MRTWCLYGRALSLKYRRFWLVDHLECKCTCIHATDVAERTWLATETMVFLTLLRTQLILLRGDAIDAFQSNVVGRKYSSRRWCRWGMTSIARRLDWVLFSTVNRIPLVKCWFFVRIRRNMSWAALWCLDVGLATALWIVCCRWCNACTDCCYACFISMRYSCLTVKLLLATSLRPNTCENPVRRIKEMLAILLRARWTRNGTATRSPSKRFPRY